MTSHPAVAASLDEVQFGLKQQSLRSEIETKEEDLHRKRVTFKPWKHIHFKDCVRKFINDKTTESRK
ncbi:hypothetical protein F7725_027056 [Dissostichus mawsoni]|uniref:Uncharacterized protein n=1 Tax=Dissostichus mawsoni TaxID=36200 RepID=A0A7J5XDY5_DISMA|nr:hypothetical protein F7725_027056 [Dissostichus mawsoni]